MPQTRRLAKTLAFAGAAAVVAIVAWIVWNNTQDQGPGPGFASGNGRIEATEIDIATKLGGRIDEVLVREGDLVAAGQLLARMQTASLRAQLDETLATRDEAHYAVAAAAALIAQRESDVAAQQAAVTQRQTELDAANRRLARSEALVKDGATSRQTRDDDRASVRSAQAALTAAQAQVIALQAAVDAAQAQHTGAQARVKSANASVTRVQADIADSDLTAPRGGRIQLRLAQPGEVLAPGGRLLNLVDLSDVYMTFFLPEAAAGRLAIGSEARIVLDAAPDLQIPANISFVASTAQFTPKTVETASERQKLMFRVRAQIPPTLLKEHINHVKTGLPGVAWVRLDADQPWPDTLGRQIVD